MDCSNTGRSAAQQDVAVSNNAVWHTAALVKCGTALCTHSSCCGARIAQRAVQVRAARRTRIESGPSTLA
jgi:hypothetical protein